MVDSSKRSIPSWQRPEDSTEQSQAETEETEVTVEASGVFADDSNDRSTLLDEAKRFLEDSAVRNAAPEHKIAFLKSKGVKSKEIQELLETDIPKQQEAYPQVTSSPASTPPQATTSTVPPIITYPEFLLRPPKPAPIVTVPRVINAISLLGATTTLVYGASKYIIAPMLDSLTSARHSLFETAITNLNTLNEKLEGVVSSSPKDALLTIEGDDASSSASDPTELFHRDVGVQTESLQSPTSDLADSLPQEKLPQEMESESLESLGQLLKEVLTHSEDILGEDVETGTKITELNLYLENLNKKPAFQSQHGRYTRYGDEQDDIAKVRAEIRGAKGALLSARTFPGGLKRVHFQIPGEKHSGEEASEGDAILPRVDRKQEHPMGLRHIAPSQGPEKRFTPFIDRYGNKGFINIQCSDSQARQIAAESILAGLDFDSQHTLSRV